MQDALQIHREGWRLKLHDAYRPNAVQAFMVEQEYQLLARAEGLVALSPQDRERLMPRVLALWGLPSDDPATPPPHSTGAAIDCTLVDETGREVPMGCPIDENSPRALPDAFADAPDATGKIAHIHRVLLNSLMRAEGFHRHPAEWWHFSKGDQMWAFEERQRGVTKAVAIYGRAVAETRIGVPNAAVAQG